MVTGAVLYPFVTLQQAGGAGHGHIEAVAGFRRQIRLWQQMPMSVAIDSDVRSGHITMDNVSRMGPESMDGKLLFRYWQIAIIQVNAFRVFGSGFTEGRLPAQSKQVVCRFLSFKHFAIILLTRRQKRRCR